MLPSIERQKASVRAQRQATKLNPEEEVNVNSLPSEFFVTDALIQPSGMTADCEQLSQLQVQSLADRAAKAQNISADLVRAVMRQESAFRPCAVSAKGAVGLMQLMPTTASDLGVKDAFDPEENAFAGAKLLRTLLERYAGDLNRTLGAYNAGPTNVDLAGGVPKFPETMDYVNKIMRELNPSAITF